jgi:DnaK suppressor protein
MANVETVKPDPSRTFPVRPGEEPWTPDEVTAQIDALETEVARLTADLAVADVELAELLRYSGDGAGDDQADSGSIVLDREQKLTFVNNTRKLLRASQLAMERVEAGTYGECESCGGPIGKARLQAFPRAALCVECKQREERR